MKKSKAKKAVSWLIAAAMANSMCAFEVSLVSATGGTQITSATTELESGKSYFIANAEGLKKLAELTNVGKVAANTAPPEAPTSGVPVHPGGSGSYIYLIYDIDLGTDDETFNPNRKVYFLFRYF